jgi:hypothetical protein
MRCPKLKQIAIVLPKGDYLARAQENRYLAAIKAIVPDFVFLHEDEFLQEKLYPEMFKD